MIHPRCVHFASEISSYTWDKDKEGNQINKPIDDNNHLMDAMRYALEPYIRRRVTDPPPKGGVPRPALQRRYAGRMGCMSIATVLIAAAGWILAAFLCGLAVGRERATRRRKSREKSRTARKQPP